MPDHDPAHLGQNAASRRRNNASSSRRGSRKFNSPTAPMSGSKRDKYTVTACYECRKRKIKCTGNEPCRRCENYDLRCEYAENTAETQRQSNSKLRIEFLTQELGQLRAQVGQLAAGMKEMRETSHRNPNLPELRQGEEGQVEYTTTGRDDVNAQRPFAAPTQPRFIGPTSSAYDFNVANNTLQMMGIQPDETGDSSRIVSAVQSRCASPEPTVQVEIPSKDLLFSIEMGETCRALEFYQEEIHPIYPFVPIEEMVRLVPSIYEHLHHSLVSSPVETDRDSCCTIKDQDVLVLKLILACTLVVEGRGQSRVGQLLVDKVESRLSASARKVEIDLQGLRIFTLTSIFYFQSDEPVLAWRTIGFAARIALEMGLHRRESLEQNFPDKIEREWAMKLFWCIYVLDRRWSFGIGMPFALQESDIDPSLPHLRETEPYLECLIGYGKICSKVWATVAGYSNKPVDRETVSYLDYQIQQWRENIPRPFQLLHPNLGEAASNQPRSLQRLRVLLYIRANQMRGFIHRHNVLSASHVSQNLEGARCVTDIAKDTIRVLVHLRETSTIYDTQENAFNYFLVSAISAIFLAVCHAPAEFSHSCRTEFYNALGILKDLSAHSYISRRLWKSIQRLRSIAPKLGLAPINSATTSYSNVNIGASQPLATTRSYNMGFSFPTGGSDRIGMAGSVQNSHPQTGSHITPSAPFAAASSSLPLTSGTSPVNMPNMHQMGNELTNLFEAFDHSVGVEQQDVASHWMTAEEMNLLQGGMEISKLFEGLL